MSKLEERLKPIPIITMNDILRFWNFIKDYKNPDTHWLWTGKPNPDGYGRFQMRSYGGFHAHRISWSIHFGDPGKNLVLHKKDCHTRLCVNPRHLYLGDQFDNMNDAIANGTMNLSGDLARRAKFDHSNILTIFERSKHGESANSIAKSYSVNHSTIDRILRGERYK